MSRKKKNQVTEDAFDLGTGTAVPDMNDFIHAKKGEPVPAAAPPAPEPEPEKKPKRKALPLYLEPDLKEWLWMHRGRTGQTMNARINQILRAVKNAEERGENILWLQRDENR